MKLDSNGAEMFLIYVCVSNGRHLIMQVLVSEMDLHGWFSRLMTGFQILIVVWLFLILQLGEF